MNKPVKSDNVPATKSMLFEVRDELKSDVRGLRHEMQASFKRIEARFEEQKARFEKADAKFEKADAKFEKMWAEVHRMGILYEEQNARNIYVLDGYTSINDRLEKVEKKTHDL